MLISNFEQHFKNITCTEFIELKFIPKIVNGIYFNGLKLSDKDYELKLPNKIRITKNFIGENNITISYKHIINN